MNSNHQLFVLNLIISDGYGYDHHDHDNDDDNEIEKTLAILIGLIAGIALIIVFLSFLRKVLGGKGMSLHPFKLFLFFYFFFLHNMQS